MSAYHDLIAGSIVRAERVGIDAIDLPAAMREHQRAATTFALEQGRAALFLDTGLGKSLCAFAWADNVARHTGKPVLMLAPLGVLAQHKAEAERFGYTAHVSRQDLDVPLSPALCLTNYDRLAKFNPRVFGGIVLDESSIIKNFSGVTTRKLMEFGAQIPFRLACTATPAPNDHMELGQHAQFLGVMSSSEMLSRWFIVDQSEMGHYRLKRHAVDSFWSWLASWARCAERPSDLGGDDTGYILPELDLRRHIVRTDITTDAGEKYGQALLFRLPSASATSIHKEKRLTADDRARRIAELVLGVDACGNLNTPSAAAPSISPTQPSESVEKPKGGRRKKTPATCASTTSETALISPAPPSSRPITTADAGNDTPLTPRSGIGQKSSHGHDAQSGNATGDSAPRSALAQPITNACSPNKADAARSATLNMATRQGDASPSIIATPPVGSADFFAQTAIKDLENSETTPIAFAEPWIIWCETDYDQDAIERLLGDLAFSVRGSMDADRKVAIQDAWIRGERPIFITKPSIFGFGCNYQHCARVAFVGLSFSYEAFYQAVRRCWRYGQSRPVTVHVACAETEETIWQTIVRKRDDHQAMKAAMRVAMARAVEVRATKLDYQPQAQAALPAWLKEAA